MMKRALVFIVWDSLTMAAIGPEPKDDDWETSEVQRQDVATAAIMVEAMLRME